MFVVNCVRQRRCVLAVHYLVPHSPRMRPSQNAIRDEGICHRVLTPSRGYAP